MDDIRLYFHLQSRGRDLKVLADIITVEHSIDIGQIYFLIGEMTALL